MCVKCGINDCGCEGKLNNSSSVLTGEVVVGPDTAYFSCADNPDNAISPGDNLNVALQKIMAQTCALPQSPLLKVVGTPVVINGNAVVAGSELTIVDVAGWYNIRIQLDVSLIVNQPLETFHADFGIGLNGLANLNTSSYTAQVTMAGYGTGIGGNQRYQSIALENVVNCQIGDVLSLLVSDYFRTPTMPDYPDVVFSIIAEYKPGYVQI